LVIYWEELHVYFKRFSLGILEELKNHLDYLNWLR